MASAEDTSTRSKVSLIVIAALSLAFAAYGFANFDQEIGTEYRNAPGWAFGALGLLIALTAVSYLVKMARGRPVR